MVKNNKIILIIIGIVALILMFNSQQKEAESNIVFTGDAFPLSTTTIESDSQSLVNGEMIAQLYNHPTIGRYNPSGLKMTNVGGADCDTYASGYQYITTTSTQNTICYRVTNHIGVAVQLWKLNSDGSWIPNQQGFLGEIHPLNGETKCFPQDEIGIGIIDSVQPNTKYRLDPYYCDDVDCICTSYESIGCGSDYGCDSDQILRRRTCPNNCDTEEVCGDWIEQNKPGCITCSNECTTSGSKQCSGNGYQTCGNYDSDSCTEWSSVTSCPSGQTCSNGQCINNDDYPMTSSSRSYLEEQCDSIGDSKVYQKYSYNIFCLIPSSWQSSECGAGTWNLIKTCAGGGETCTPGDIKCVGEGAVFICLADNIWDRYETKPFCFTWGQYNNTCISSNIVSQLDIDQICESGSGCIADTCESLGRECGTVSTNCYTTLNCGNCSSGETCSNGQCSGGDDDEEATDNCNNECMSFVMSCKEMEGGDYTVDGKSYGCKINMIIYIMGGLMLLLIVMKSIGKK